MTICRRWTMTTCGAGSRPRTKQFDEATAILAGDGLLTFAFDILARTRPIRIRRCASSWSLALARAAGLGGMVGGQMLDLAAEGRFDGGKAQRLGERRRR